MAIDPFTPSSNTARRNGDLFVRMRGSLDDLQRQLATGKKTDAFSELGVDRRISIDSRAKLGALEGWTKAIDQGSLRITFMMDSIERFAGNTRDAKGDARPGAYVMGADGEVAGQILARDRLSQSIDLLNAEIGGRYLFSGRTHDVKPVEDFSVIMKPIGSPGPAGLRQLIAERHDADRGVNDLGRLTTAVAGSVVSIGREAPLPDAGYGFQVSAATSTAPGINPAFAAGPPASASLTVATVPAPGGRVSLEVTMADGAKRTIDLEVRAQGSTGPAETGFNIDPLSTANTATNLENAVRAALQKETRTALQAFSATTAARDFFSGSALNQPPRIPGVAPFTTVTAPPAAGLPGATVIWYKGEAASSPTDLARNTSPLQIDNGQVVAAGSRANEEAFREGLVGFAVLAAGSFTAADPNSRDRYEATAERVRMTLSFGSKQKPEQIAMEISTAQVAMKSAKERHKFATDFFETARAGVEDATQEEVASSLLALQTRLQATYQTTAILSRLSLVNYLN